MKLATWNVNSIRARHDRLLAFLDRHSPDVVCLQELKVTESDFPSLSIKAAGYHAAVLGQKTYNGVAILSKTPLEDVQRGMDDGNDDPQARLISAMVRGVRVYSAYFPNGQSIGSDKYEYKLEWMARLRRHLDQQRSASEPLVVAGDFNVAPEARDVHDPKAWDASVLCHPSMREALGNVRGFGLADCFRNVRDESGLYSWWDYRMLAFPKGRGLRIDHIDATAALANRCHKAYIDRDERKGKQPSDHAPLFAEFDVD